MKRPELMCLAYTNPNRCNGFGTYCNQCYQADVIHIPYCDICKREIRDDEEIYSVTHVRTNQKKEVCEDCYKKIKKMER